MSINSPRCSANPCGRSHQLSAFACVAQGGLYSVSLDLKQIPFLEDGQRRKNQSKIVRDAMTKQNSAGRSTDGVVCFNEVESNVTDVLAKLAGNSHNGFPVVRQMTDGRRLFRGLVLRNQVLALIAQQHLKFDGAETVHVDSYQSVDMDNTGPKERVGFDTTDEFAEEFLRLSGNVSGGMSAGDGNIRGPHRSAVPRLIEALVPGSSARSSGTSRAFAMMSLDLAQVMQKSPFTIDELCPLPRVWRLFRSMGLRHLVVLDQEHCVVGIITRADLLAASTVDL
jgi:CBS domain-containing protein